MADYVTTGYWSASYAVEDPVIPEPQTLAEQVADAVFARIVEGGYSFDQIIRVMAAALAGQRSGLGTATETYTGLDGATTRISLTPDQNGNGTPAVNGAA